MIPSPSNSPRVLAARTVVIDGQIRMRLLLDASRELGRGRSYWLHYSKMGKDQTIEVPQEKKRLPMEDFSS